MSIDQQSIMEVGVTDSCNSAEPKCCKCGHPQPELQFRPCGCKMHVMCVPLSTICKTASEAKTSDEMECPSCGAKVSEGIYLYPIDVKALEDVALSKRSVPRQEDHILLEEFYASIAPIFLIPTSQDSVNKLSEDAYFRNGRWAAEEVDFVDYAMKLFHSGSLPIPTGTTLNDFLRGLLLCKSTRLRKKIKHANFCTRTYHPRLWDIKESLEEVTKLSNLQANFFSTLDVEGDQSLLKFSMARTWGILFSKFCVDIGYESLSMEDWLNGLEQMEAKSQAAQHARKRVERRKRVDCTPHNGIDTGGYSYSGGQDMSNTSNLYPNIERTTTSSSSMDEILKSKRARVEETLFAPPPDSEMMSICNQLADWNPFIDRISRFMVEEKLPFQYMDVWITDTGRNDDTQERGQDSEEKSPFSVSLRQVGYRTNPVTECIFTMYHMNEFGKYSSNFKFTPGVGLPGRVYTSCMPTWDVGINKSTLTDFPRVNGANSHGLHTALGIPLVSGSEGKIIVIALYGSGIIPKDESLIQKCSIEFQKYNPRVRLDLVLDIGKCSHSSSETLCLPSQDDESAQSVIYKKDNPEGDIIDLLGKYSPLEIGSSPLLQSFTSLRLILLRATSQRSTMEANAIDTLKLSYNHYLLSNRSESDIATLLANEWAVLSNGFYSQPNQQAASSNLDEEMDISNDAFLNLLTT